MKTSYTHEEANDLRFNYRKEPVLVHPDYYHHNVIDLIDDHIRSYNAKNIHDLTQEDKQEIVAYLIEASGQMDEFCCITESKDSDQTINLFKKLLSRDNEDNRTHFVEAIMKNAVTYFEDIISELFEDRLNRIQSDRMEEAGYKLYTDANHGDTVWRKRYT